jgi:diguanylate cyclase (GGDEF)-like protein
VPWTVIGISAFEAILHPFALSDRIRTLREEKDEARSRERRYRTLAITDELTGLNNVRFFRTQLPLETQRAEKLHLPLTLGLLDIDRFKAFNDTYGHPAGDDALRQLGEVIMHCVRERDVACRYGGEEFVILFPATRAAEAFEAAERIRMSYEQCRRAAGMPHSGATVSFGLAEYVHGERPEDLVDRADRALYKAKHIGRNRTVIAPHK